DAALPHRTRHHAGRTAAGGRAPAVRRAAVRPRRQASPRARRSARAGDAGAGGVMSRVESAPPRRAGLRDLVGQVLPGEAATLRAAQESLDGKRRGLRALWPFLGPAFIASVAYVDPG